MDIANDNKEDIECEICIVRCIQEKMAHLLLEAPNLSLEEEQNIMKNYLKMMNSSTDMIIIYVQILYKVKNELAFTRLDLERAIKTQKEVKYYENRMYWLQNKLRELTLRCHKLFFDLEQNLFGDDCEFLQNLSQKLKNLLVSSAKSPLFKTPCICHKKRDYQNKFQEHLKNEFFSSHVTDNTKFKPCSPQTPALDMKILSKQQRRRLQHNNIISTATDKKELSSVLPWEEKPIHNMVADSQVVALNRLSDRLHKMYGFVKDTTAHRHDNNVLKGDENTITMLPPIIVDVPTSLVARETKSSTEEKTKDKTSSTIDFERLTEGINLLSMELAEKKEKKICVYPRSPSVWCKEPYRNQSTSLSYVKFIPNKEKRRKSLSVSASSEGQLSNRLTTKATMKRAAVRICAVAKIKRQICSSARHLNELKIRRIQDLLGDAGLLSKNQQTAVDAAKSLGQLKCSEDFVLEGLGTILKENKTSLLAYESSKSLLLLGHWNEDAMAVLTHRIRHSNSQVQADILSTIKISPNAQFIPKSCVPLKDLSNALIHLVEHSNEQLAVEAATCLGHLCIINKEAQDLLLRNLNTSSYSIVDNALYVLVKQMNCKEDVVVNSLLHQISHANSWKHRIRAADLLKFIGPRGVKHYNMQQVFNVLHELLWKHPNKEFRSKISDLLSEFGMKEEAYEITMRRLEDKSETVRSEAINALATLEIKGDKELKILLDIFGLDSSNYVRTQVIKAFVGLRWNHPRVMRALQDRQKGDDVLAEEASKALEILSSLS